MSAVEAPLQPTAAVSDRLQKQDIAIDQKIDPSFIYPEDQRARIAHDCFDANLPVVDLGPVLYLRRLRKEIDQQLDLKSRRNYVKEEIEQCEAAKASVEREIRAACEQLGFFQIVNHGFPMHLVEKLTESARHVFDLPLEEKMKASQLPPSKDKPIKSPGYSPMTRSGTYQKAKKSWNEAFGMDCPEVIFPGTLEDNVSALWPEEPERSSKGLQFRSTKEEYAKEANILSLCLLDLMAGGLGLPEGTLERFFGWGPETQVEARLNVERYPICPHPELTFGVIGHTDPSLITLLHQDTVGGLQIRFKDGSWHGVRPMPGAFVINVGNSLQACTNGRFISAEHRVVTNNKADRLSIVYFVFDKMDSVFSPIPELLDAENPPLYRPFSRREYFEILQKYGKVSDKSIVNFTDIFRHQVAN